MYIIYELCINISENVVQSILRKYIPIYNIYNYNYDMRFVLSHIHMDIFVNVTPPSKFLETSWMVQIYM